MRATKLRADRLALHSVDSRYQLAKPRGVDVLFDSEEDQVADRYFGFVNDVVGVMALSLAATALQFERPAPFAVIFLVSLFVWALSRGGEYRKIAKRYLLRYQGFWGFLMLTWRLIIFLIGFLALIGIMLGVVTKNSIYAALPFL